MTFVRRFGILILGIVFVVGGVAGFAASVPQPSFGWSAYAPLTRVTFTPQADTGFLGLAVIGLILTAGWVGHRIGARGAR